MLGTTANTVSRQTFDPMLPIVVQQRHGDEEAEQAEEPKTTVASKGGYHDPLDVYQTVKDNYDTDYTESEESSSSSASEEHKHVPSTSESEREIDDIPVTSESEEGEEKKEEVPSTKERRKSLLITSLNKMGKNKIHKGKGKRSKTLSFYSFGESTEVSLLGPEDITRMRTPDIDDLLHSGRKLSDEQIRAIPVEKIEHSRSIQRQLSESNTYPVLTPRQQRKVKEARNFHIIKKNLGKLTIPQLEKIKPKYILQLDLERIRKKLDQEKIKVLLNKHWRDLDPIKVNELISCLFEENWLHLDYELVLRYCRTPSNEKNLKRYQQKAFARAKRTEKIIIQLKKLSEVETSSERKKVLKTIHRLFFRREKAKNYLDNKVRMKIFRVDANLLNDLRILKETGRINVLPQAEEFLIFKNCHDLSKKRFCDKEIKRFVIDLEGQAKDSFISDSLLGQNRVYAFNEDPDGDKCFTMSHCDGFSAATGSLFPRIPDEKGNLSVRFGDPIADDFLFCRYPRGIFLSIADGCGVSETARKAASTVNRAFIDTMMKAMAKGVASVHALLELLNLSDRKAQKAVLELERGGAKHLGLMAINKGTSRSKRPWQIFFSRKGDPKVFCYSRKANSCIDLTKGPYRVPSQLVLSGGLGDWHKGAPNLRNYGIYSVEAAENVLIVAMTSGISENLDPQNLSITPEKAFLTLAEHDSLPISLLYQPEFFKGKYNTWESCPYKEELKDVYREWLVKILIHEANFRHEEVGSRIARFAQELTDPLRKWLEQNPDQNDAEIGVPIDVVLKGEACQAVTKGKLNHATVVAFTLPKIRNSSPRKKKEK